MAFRFSDLTPCGKLRALWKGQQTILAKLEQIMTREDDIKQDVADAAAAGAKQGVEIIELITTGNAAVAALRAANGALADANAALIAARDAAVANAVSDAVAAELRATTDAAVAAADEKVAAADAAEAEWTAIAQPTPPAP